MARLFDGSDDKIVLPDNSETDRAIPVTIFGWFRHSSEQTGAFYACSQGALGNRYFFFEIGQPLTGSLTNELITVQFRDGGSATSVGYETTTRTELFDGNWHPISVTCNGTAWVIYLDGVSKTLTVGEGSNTGDYRPASPDTFIWGARKLAGSLSVFELGDSGECCLFGSTLNSTIEGALSRGVNPFPLIPLIHNPFYGNDSPEGDYHQQNSKGTLTGTTKSSSHPPVQLISEYL